MENQPPQFPRFHLRFDFADEFCFWEETTKPLTENMWLVTCLQLKRPVSWIELEQHNRERAVRSRPHLYQYGAAIRPGTREPEMYLTDRRAWQFVSADGLFGDLLDRVRLVTGTPKDGRPPIVPESLKTPSKSWKLGDFVVLQEFGQSVAEVVSREEANKRMREQNNVNDDQ